MRKRLVVIVTVAGIVALFARWYFYTPPIPDFGRKVLVFSKTSEFRHDSIPDGVAATFALWTEDPLTDKKAKVAESSVELVALQDSQVTLDSTVPRKSEKGYSVSCWFLSEWLSRRALSSSSRSSWGLS